MCIGVPMQILEKKNGTGIVEINGVKREIGLMLLEDIDVGDWVIVHAGFAISKLEDEEAEETMDLLKEIEYID
jgi:hydrogenase expression/formation protein HypC